MMTDRMRKHAAILLAAVLAAGYLSGCRIRSSVAFPPLEPNITQETTSGNGSQTDPGTAGPDKQPLVLQLAVPFSDAVAEPLRLLFLARQSGILIQDEGQYIGHQIQLDDLQQFDGDLVLEIESVSAAAGLSEEQIRVRMAAQTMPDLFYSAELAAWPGLDQVADLSAALSDHSLLSPVSLFPAAVGALRQGSSLYGVPYLASVPLQYSNQSLLDMLQVEPPQAGWTWAEWQAWLSDVQDRITRSGLDATPATLLALADDEAGTRARLQSAIWPVSDLSSYLPFVAASVHADAGWGMWNGYTFALLDPAFHMSAAWLREMALDGWSPLHLSTDQRITALSGQDARLQGRVVSWVGDSSDLSYWHQITSVTVTENLMPSGSIRNDPGSSEASLNDKTMRQPIQVRALAVSQTSRFVALAADMAAFLALDPDALLLQSRYQLYEGLFPVVRDPFVWQMLVGRQPYGQYLLQVYNRLDQAYCSGRQIVPNWQRVMTDALGTAARQYLREPDPDLAAELYQKIQQAANRSMHGGD